MRRAFFAFLALALAACSSSTSTGNGSPPTPLPSAALVRGAVLSVTHVATLRKSDMVSGLALSTVAALGGPPECDVAIYMIRYATIGAHGEPADASEGFYVPQRGCRGPFLMVGYAQGTNFLRAMKISNPTKRNVEPGIIAAVYAAHGYVVAATDYLGLGYSTYPYEPYLVSASEASAVIDAMRAARHAAPNLGVALSGKVFLAGYSQGGHSIVATQRAIEAQAPDEFDVVGNDPGSGPYALADWVKLLSHGQTSTFFAFLVPGYNKVYANLYAEPSDVFKPPYDAYVNDLLPVDTYAQQNDLNGKTLPVQLDRLLRPAFIDALQNDPRSAIRRDLAANEVLPGWKPSTPIYLCAGKRDPEVDYKNSLIAYAYLKGEGVKVTLDDLDSLVPPSISTSLYHDAIFVLCSVVERVKALDSAKPQQRLFRREAVHLDDLRPMMGSAYQP